MKNLIYFIQVFFLLVTCNSILCQDYSWQGGNGEWDNPEMWYPYGVPQSGDEVFIAKGTVHIQNGYSAYSKFIEVHSSGSLNVNSNSRLSVIGNIGGVGILNHGIIEIYGEVESNDHTGSTNEGIGCRNFGKFYIYSQGSYSSTGCEKYALLNEQFGFCSNAGSIEIINNGKGIKNFGKFFNSNSIYINDVDGNHGIVNYGDFSNNAFSIIRILGNTEFGIISRESPQNNQMPSFSNKGKIIVRESSFWCIIVVHGTFSNLDNGMISVSQSQHSGLVVDGISTFENFGTLIAQNNMQDGIRGIGNLINEGLIISEYNGESGLSFFDIWTPEVGSIVNSGEIQLNNNALNDIILDGIILHNTDEGYIYTENELEGTEIINDGIFSTWYNGNHNITFENNGVVEDVYNSLSSLQNNQIRIRPLDGPLVEEEIFDDALDKVSSSNTIISFGWYDQINNGNAGALYFSGSNSIYPNSYGATAPTLWMDAKIKSSGQIRKLRVNILNAPWNLTQNQNNTAIQKDGLQESPTFNIYPNPIANSFKVEANVWKKDPYILKLYDTSGREVLSRKISKADHIKLPSTIKDGIFIGVVYEGKKVIFKKKMVVSRGASAAKY
jgi:hypothetical protein